jgi:hypothetical protein
MQRAVSILNSIDFPASVRGSFMLGAAGPPVYMSVLDQFRLLVSLVIHRRYRFDPRLIQASKGGKKVESFGKKGVEYQTFSTESYLNL